MTSTLHEAAEAGDLPAVVELLATGADANVTVNGGVSPLFFSCYHGYLEICQALVKGGGDVNYRDEGGGTPLHCAAVGGRGDVVKYLIECGARMDVKTQDGRGPGDVAEDKEIVAFIMARTETKRPSLSVDIKAINNSTSTAGKFHMTPTTQSKGTFTKPTMSLSVDIKAINSSTPTAGNFYLTPTLGTPLGIALSLDTRAINSSTPTAGRFHKTAALTLDTTAINGSTPTAGRYHLTSALSLDTVAINDSTPTAERFHKTSISAPLPAPPATATGLAVKKVDAIGGDAYWATVNADMGSMSSSDEDAPPSPSPASAWEQNSRLQLRVTLLEAEVASMRDLLRARPPPESDLALKRAAEKLDAAQTKFVQINAKLEEAEQRFSSLTKESRATDVFFAGAQLAAEAMARGDDDFTPPKPAPIHDFPSKPYDPIVYSPKRASYSPAKYSPKRAQPMNW